MICQEKMWKKQAGMDTAPCLQTTTNRIIRLLVMFNIKTMHIPKNNAHQLIQVKDDLGCRVLGIYCIPLECSMCIIGQMVHAIDNNECGRHV
jgi:hypothetical protein